MMSEDKNVKILVCGDIALCLGVEQMILNGNGDDLAIDFRINSKRADFFLANIEVPVTDSDEPEWNHFKTLKGKCKTGIILKDLGIDVASLANNHIADYGLRGFKDTVAVLKELDIDWVGAGMSPKEAVEPLIVEKKNYRIGIVALAQPEISAARKGKWGAGVLTKKEAVNAIKKIKNDTDIIIAYLHFGVEHFEYPTPSQVSLSHSLIDAGANLVIGHHPHVPQGYEYYNNGFIAYSLGNFIFDMNPGAHKFSRTGLLVEIDVNQNCLKKVKIIPVDTSGGNPRLISGEALAEVEAYLDKLCFCLKDRNKLINKYYFTCRENLLMHLRSIANFIFIKKNIYNIRDWIKQQFWPQLFELRKDLLCFLLSGEALKYEKENGPPAEGVISYLWRGVCWICWLIGCGWGRLLRVK